MFNTFIKRRWLQAALSFVIFCSLLFSVFSMSASAEMETIDTWSNIDLIHQHLNSMQKDGVWDSSAAGRLVQSSGNYTLYSNGWAQWSVADNMDFAYQKIDFNYTKKTVLTVETTMTSFDGKNDKSGAGIMIRSGLADDAACVMFHFRQGQIMITYRMQDGNNTVQGTTESMSTSPLYPVTFKVEIVKGESKVRCFYKVKDGQYSEFGTAPFVYGGDIYAGISSYSQQQDFVSAAKFSYYASNLKAPPGWSKTESGDNGSSEPAEETKITLPEDLPPADDVLLRETFTDGSMVNDIASVTNPIWKMSSLSEPDIKINDGQTNRWLYEYMTQNWYYAGDKKWTDYRVSMDLTFTNEYSPGAANEFNLYVRHTDIAQYGNQDYAVVLAYNIASGAQTIAIGHRDGISSFNGAATIYADTVKTLNYLSTPTTPNVKHTLTVDAFDNVITVYWDGVKVTQYTDTGNLVKGQGNIGFSTNSAAVEIDNIIVQKRLDLMGGDYDNSIAGNWDRPVPDYLSEWKKNGWSY